MPIFGLDILTENENVKTDKIMEHGSFFKTHEVGQRMLTVAMNSDVSVDVNGFNEFMKNYKSCLVIEKSAIESLK